MSSFDRPVTESTDSKENAPSITMASDYQFTHFRLSFKLDRIGIESLDTKAASTSNKLNRCSQVIWQYGQLNFKLPAKRAVNCQRLENDESSKWRCHLAD